MSILTADAAGESVTILHPIIFMEKIYFSQSSHLSPNKRRKCTYPAGCVSNNTVTTEESVQDSNCKSHIPECKLQKQKRACSTSTWMCVRQHRGKSTVILGNPQCPGYLLYTRGRRPGCHPSKTRHVFPYTEFPSNTTIEQQFAFHGKHHLRGIKSCLLFTQLRK